MDTYDHLIKVAVLGDTSVGKTAMIHRLSTGVFRATHESTICMDFCTHIATRDSKTYKIQIWDTAGQERFRSIVKTYFRSCNIAILCFSLDDNESFLNLDMWRELVLKSNPTVSFILVGMKGDVKWKIKSEDAELWATGHGITYHTISSKEGTGLDGLVDTIIDLWDTHCPVCPPATISLLSRAHCKVKEQQKSCCN